MPTPWYDRPPLWLVALLGLAVLGLLALVLAGHGSWTDLNPFAYP